MLKLKEKYYACLRVNLELTTDVIQRLKVDENHRNLLETNPWANFIFTLIS